MPYNSYNVHFNKLAAWLMPRWLRKQKFVILLQACVFPLVLIHDSFLRYRKAKLYDLKINFQVCYLESFLNDRFDFSERRIWIGEIDLQQTVFLFQRNELKPVLIYRRSEDHPRTVYLRGETGGDISYDFIIYIPAGISFQEPEVRAMISNNLCGKRYKIEIV